MTSKSPPEQMNLVLKTSSSMFSTPGRLLVPTAPLIFVANSRIDSPVPRVISVQMCLFYFNFFVRKSVFNGIC